MVKEQTYRDHIQEYFVKNPYKTNKIDCSEFKENFKFDNQM